MSLNNSQESNTQPLIGYCHQCDRQVEIDRQSFSCKQCQGGFIELFEMERNEYRGPSSGIREEPLRFNTNIHNNPIQNILPLLLSNLINPSRIPEVQNGSQPTQVPPRPQRFGTRVQFIVPGNRLIEPGQEQFDLYGIINNVISDLLDPNRPGQNIQAQPIRMFQLHGDMRDYAWGTNGLDTIITQLLNQLENTGPPPATEDQLKNLPQLVISEQEVERSAQCAICMEDFNLKEIAIKLPCKHLFHEPCITEWLKIHGTCPVCRKNLNGEDTSQREYISRPPSTRDTPNSSIQNQPTSGTETETNNQNEPNNNQSSSTYYEPDFD